MGEDQEDEENGELYRDLNLNMGRQDAEMTDAQSNQETEEAHVTLTTELPVVQQQSSSISSDLVAKFITSFPIQNKLRKEAQAENQDFLNSLDSNVKRIIKEHVINSNTKIEDKSREIVIFETLEAEALRNVLIKTKDEEPSTGSNRGSKRQRSGKEESSKEATPKKLKSTGSSKGVTRSPPKSSSKSAQEEEHNPRVDDLE
ncbi:hypothetical protein Tco_0290058 [Tanacetum coccineum]